MLKEKDFLRAEFTTSATKLTQFPNQQIPEVAFAGRSNVGKSSLMNAVFQRKGLVKTSSTPGKTQLINFFNVADKMHMVDLPGYGYAKLPKAQKATWQKMIESYITESPQLRSLYLLIDSRHKPMQIDLEMIEWLNYIQINYALVLSKTDKIKKREISQKLSIFKELCPGKKIIPFSIKDKASVVLLRRNIIESLK